MKKSIIGLLIIFLFLGFSTSLYASQEKKERPELKKEIVKVKYIKAVKAVKLLHVYASMYGRIMYDDDLKLITIMDTPEIVDKMLSVVKEIDIKPIDLVFTVDIILGLKGDKSAEGIGEGMPAAPLLKELKKLLNYRVFKLIDTSFIRVQENKYSEQRVGGTNYDFRLRLNPRYIKDENVDIIQLEVELLHDRVVNMGPSLKRETNVPLIKTVLTIKSGDKSVVGVSKLNGGDKALILIIQGKVIK